MIPQLSAILGLMLLVVLLATIGITIDVVTEYNLRAYLEVAAVAALALLFGLKARIRLLAGAATVVGAGALIVAAVTVIDSENRKDAAKEARYLHHQVQSLLDSAGREMGRRYPLKTFGQSSPDYVEFTDRVDAKFRASRISQETGKGKVTKDLCRVVITHELGLRNPYFAKADLTSSAPFAAYDTGDFIDFRWLQAFSNLNTAPRYPETVARCASIFGFKVPA